MCTTGISKSLLLGTIPGTTSVLCSFFKSKACKSNFFIQARSSCMTYAFRCSCGVQKYRLYLKRVSGVSPTQGRRGIGSQPEWPALIGPASGMGMAPTQPQMGSFVPVSPACPSLTVQHKACSAGSQAPARYVQWQSAVSS